MVPDAAGKELLPFAYNILGSWQDAKDVVQEVILQRLKHTNGGIENEKAYLVRSVINRAINLKNRRKKETALYPGTWLPEPVATEGADHELHRSDILSYSLMILMEKLDARARAVFILKEAFEYDHTEIAAVLHTTAQNSRQILSRAKKQLGPAHRRTGATKPPSEVLLQYMESIRTGDMATLEALLKEDIVSASDGGGKAVAALHPLVGRQSVLAFVTGIYRKFYGQARIQAGMVNHQPALFYFEKDRLVTCQVMAFEGGQINRFFFIRNPDKLAALEASLPSGGRHNTIYPAQPAS